MSGDRLGVRWEFAGGATLASVNRANGAARIALADGFDNLWMSHATAVDPVVALAWVADTAPCSSELGTSVVPLDGRRPRPGGSVWQ